jgi:hypothetical protein
MITKKCILFFAALFCLASAMHAGKPKAITITPDHILKDKTSTSYYCISFLPLTPGQLNYNSKSRAVKLPPSNGQCGFAQQFCFELSFLGQKFPPLYFSDLGGKKMCAYVDVNRNLDYTDDGEPIYADMDGKIKLHIEDPLYEKIAVDCIYEMIPAKTNTLEHADRVAAGFETNFPDRKKLDPEYWLFCRPQIVKAQNIIIGQDSMSVVLIDGDCDGRYSGSRDRVALLPYGVDSAASRLGSGAHVIKDELILGYKGKAYEVAMDHGYTILLKPRPDLPPPLEVIIGKPLPHFNVTLLDGKSVDIYSLLIPGMPTYINFWSSESEFFEEGNKAVCDLFNTKQDSINIISFSLNIETSETKKYVSQNHMEWTQCVSDEDVENLLYRDGQTPYAIVIDKNGIVYEVDADCFFVLFLLADLYK